jgi:GrpB-like predicted nucleotidyltransferase (UPF0157 family)
VNVIVVPHDPGWRRKFEVEAEIIGVALGLAVSFIHHVGSTSIPGIYAKPVIDILVEASSYEAVDQKGNSLVAKGYEALGEFGLPGRRYFRKDSARGAREFQIHVFLAGSVEAARHLAFRDYMRSHRAAAAEYSQLKRDLARQFPSDIDAYMDGKNPFIKATDQAALAWSRSA